MINVLLVTGSLKVGGLEAVVMNCARYLPSSAYRFDFLCWDDTVGEFEAEAASLGGRVIKIPPPKNGYAAFYTAVNNVIRNNGPYDVVHSHVFFLSGLVLAAARRCGVPIRVAHSHSVKRKNDGKLSRRLYSTAMRALINRTATVRCACSTAAGRYLFGAKRFDESGVVLPNIVNSEAFVFSAEDRAAVRREFGITDEQIVIGHVGHLLPVKNQAFLLELFRAYAQTNDARLLMVGDGPEKERLVQTSVDLGIRDKVIFGGTRMDVNRLMSAFDVFVLPSFHEGLPLTVIEAMSNGLSYVMERRVAAKEIAAFENGVFVDGYDTALWCDALNEAVRRGRYDCAACRQQLTAFSVDHFKDVLTAMYA